jgi:hypothetical protein
MRTPEPLSGRFAWNAAIRASAARLIPAVVDGVYL